MTFSADQARHDLITFGPVTEGPRGEIQPHLMPRAIESCHEEHRAARSAVQISGTLRPSHGEVGPTGHQAPGGHAMSTERTC